MLAARLLGILLPLELGEAIKLGTIQSIPEGASVAPRSHGDDQCARHRRFAMRGLLEFARDDGGLVKRSHLGRASEASVLAASLAAHGFEGPRTVLEGEFATRRITDRAMCAMQSSER